MISFNQYVLRPLELEDLEDYYSLVERNRTRLEDFFAGTVSRTHDMSRTREFLDEMIKKRKEKSYYPFIIADENTNKLIAFFDLKNID